MADIILLRDFQASQIEFWLPTSYLGYDVSSFGRVRSWWVRKALGIGKGSVTSLGETFRILKPVPYAGGYRVVAVARNAKGRPKYVSLHRLVAQIFVPVVDGLPHVNHLNCVKSDCRSGNLEWTVPKKNTAHGITAGVIKVVGADNPMARLEENQIRQIKTLSRLGMSRQELAELFRVSGSHIWAIVTRRKWKHVSLPTPFHF